MNYLPADGQDGEENSDYWVNWTAMDDVIEEANAAANNQHEGFQEPADQAEIGEGIDEIIGKDGWTVVGKAERS